MHLGEGDRGETEGVERAAHEREAKVALRVDRRGSAHHDEAYRTTATTATHWPRVTRLREQDGDDAREERVRRVQDDVELHTRLVERHVVKREAVADRREQQSASHAARLASIHKPPTSIHNPPTSICATQEAKTTPRPGQRADSSSS